MSRRLLPQTVICQQLVEKVTAYLEGDLDPADRAAVEDHLAHCDHCNGYVQQVRRMLELTSELPGPNDVPHDLLEMLMTRYRQGR